MSSDVATALLLIDFLNDMRFAGGKSLLEAATLAARNTVALKTRARAAGAAIIYVNDNFGDWRASRSDIYRRCTRARAIGAAVARIAKPGVKDYFVLKPRHSAFYCTSLEPLLESLRVRRLILTGLTTDMCVLFTANDAYVRRYELLIPADCSAAITLQAHRMAIEYFRTVLGARTMPSDALRLKANSRRRAGGSR